MSRIFRVLFAWLCWFVACQGKLEGQDSLTLTSEVRSALATTEHVLVEVPMCLYGTGIHVEQAFPPTAVRTGRNGFQDMICPVAVGLAFVGISHNHTIQDDGTRHCWFRFPGTEVPTSDLRSFREAKMLVSIIVCGDTLTYITTDERERHTTLGVEGYGQAQR